MNTITKSVTKSVIALLFGAVIFGSAQASASDRPNYCSINHDHRSHNASYYNYFQKDSYYRAGSYRADRSYDRSRRHNRHGRRDRHNRNYDRGYDRGYDSRSHRARSRVVNRESYSTRYHARIVLVEEVYYTRSGRKQLVCSVLVKGPEAYHVSQRRLERVANRNCSRRARIQYL